MTKTARMVAVLGLTVALAAGCARPGELGSTEPAAAPPPAPPAAAPAPPTGPVLIGTGRIEDRVALRTLGPAVFSVRTVVVPPGGTTGWHRHPGTEMSVVKSGSITLLRENACEPAVIGPGQAVFIPDAQPHLARNDGTEPAELVVTYLLAPDVPDRGDVPPAC